MKMHSGVRVFCFLALACLLGAMPSFAQCLPAITSRLGGDVPHLTPIDSNRILVAYNRGLNIYNVSNAAAPVLTGRIEVDESLGKMRMISGRAYVLTDDGPTQHIRAYTVSGAAPVLHSTLMSGAELDFDSSGNYIHVVSHEGLTDTIVTAIDVSPRDFPLLLGRLTLPPPSSWFSSVGISVSGSRAFVSYFVNTGVRLAAINITNPASMSVLGAYDDGFAFLFGTVVTSGNYAYACRGGSLKILSLSSFPSFAQVGEIPNIGAYDAAVLGSTLFVASSYGGVRPYSLATPAAPLPYTPFNTPGTSSDIAINGDRLYNADREGGVSILQIGNPSAITQIGSIAAPAPSRVLDVVESGTTLYVLDELGLRIFSTASPDAPSLLGSLTLPDTQTDGCSSRTLGVFNSNAYITGCGRHLYVVGVANPAAPFLRADLSSFDADYDTAFFGSYAYFCGQPGLRIVNIANPSSPVTVGTYAFGGVTVSVEIVGSTLYLGTRDNGLWILSLANPAAPQLVGFSATPLRGAGFGLQVAGNTAFVGHQTGLEVIDVSNPANPIVLAFQPEIRSDVGRPLVYRNGVLHVDGYLGNGYEGDGIHRVDVSTQTRPVVVGSLPGRFSGFTAIGSRIYAGDEDRGDLVASSIQTQWKPAFRRHPEDTIACPGSYALLSVNVSALPAAVTYRWQKDDLPLPLGGRFVGADQANLTILNLVLSDEGTYTCIATNTCGSTTSLDARLTFCIGDYNCDGGIDGTDVEAFFDAWEAGDAQADVNEDGGIDGADVEYFFARWEAGC